VAAGGGDPLVDSDSRGLLHGQLAAAFLQKTGEMTQGGRRGQKVGWRCHISSPCAICRLVSIPVCSTAAGRLSSISDERRHESTRSAGESKQAATAPLARAVSDRVRDVSIFAVPVDFGGGWFYSPSCDANRQK
jgi:hypothetical protein